ncbi:MAG: helix-turn-helix transcriptional regulator [Frankiales bacterium]|nr:helix-turn-helix transcriptional regulator [Frankiales bacterium]
MEAEPVPAGPSALDAARAALAQGDWAGAAAGFRAVLADGEDAAALEGLAQCAWWQDDAEVCLGSREAAYRCHRAAGDDLGAARAATALAWDSLLFGRGAAVAQGWARRARDLLGAVPEAAEHGWLAVREAELALALGHDQVAAQASAERARDLGHRLGDSDLELAGQAFSGLAQVSGGQLAEGMARLDAAVAGATAGDVSDLMWMGKICCWLIVACHETQDVERAADWCRRVETICLDRDLRPLFNVCRIQYASLQVSRGTWPDAERELTGALDRLAGSQRGSRLDAVAQLGELRRRQGRLDEADALLAQAEFVPEAVVSRALVRLARGDAPAARRMLAEQLAQIPPAHRLARAAVLPAAAAAALAAGERDTAAAVADELRETADLVGTDALLGHAAAVEAALHDGPDAVARWSEAVRRYASAGLRFDEAEARLRLGEALLAEGDRGSGREQVLLAADAFAALAAGAHLERARSLLGAGPDASPLTARQTEILRLIAQGRTNAEIAAALHLSEHTVHRHVSNILTALGLGTRAAATAYAAGHGLI